MNILTLTNEEKGYIIAGILFLLLFIPLIISAVIFKMEANKYKPKRNNDIPIRTTEKKTVEYNHEWLPYKLKESVMTNREKIMYHILAEYCNKNKLVLLSKVRIADFVEPIHTNNQRNFYHWFNKISAKHIDYLICDPNSFKPKAAIELDDSTHLYKNRKNRDLFVDNVYRSVELPVLHFWDINENSVNIQLNELFGIKVNNVD